MKSNTDNKDCPCKSINCVRHGNCEECKEYHYSKDSLPTCER